MRFGKADVFVEMKHFDTAPVDAGRGGERCEKFELRGAGGGDDASFTTRRNGCANNGGSAIRGSGGQRLFVGEFLQLHVAPFGMRMRFQESERVSYVIHVDLRLAKVQKSDVAGVTRMKGAYDQ